MLPFSLLAQQTRDNFRAVAWFLVALAQLESCQVGFRARGSRNLFSAYGTSTQGCICCAYSGETVRVSLLSRRSFPRNDTKVIRHRRCGNRLDSSQTRLQLQFG